MTRPSSTTATAAAPTTTTTATTTPTTSTTATAAATPAVAGTTDRYRSRSAERDACLLLRDAAVAFDGLVTIARRHGVLDDDRVRRSLGDVVDRITTSIAGSTAGSTSGAAECARSGGDVGSVLIERAAARFSTRVLGTATGLRPCPPDVLSALHAARQALVAAHPDEPAPAEPATVVVVYGLLRDATRTAALVSALADRRGAPVHLVGTPVRVRSVEARTILDLEYGNGSTGARLAGAHLGWIAQRLDAAGHRVGSVSVVTGSIGADVDRLVRPHVGQTGDQPTGDGRTGRSSTTTAPTALVVTVGRFAAARTLLLRRRLRHADVVVTRAGRDRPGPGPVRTVGE